MITRNDIIKELKKHKNKKKAEKHAQIEAHLEGLVDEKERKKILDDLISYAEY